MYLVCNKHCASTYNNIKLILFFSLFYRWKKMEVLTDDLLKTM